MEEERTSLPVRPVTREEGYLSAILGELKAIRKALAPPGKVPEDGELLLDDEVKLRERRG